MTQQTLAVPMSEVAPSISESTNSAWASDTEYDEFAYTPVSPWAPVALVLGIASLTGFFGLFGLGLALVGVILGIVAVVRVRAGGNAVKGTGFAVTGLVLSLLCLVLGSAKMAHAYQTEVPDGFLRVNFPVEIAEKQFVYYGGTRRLHPDVAPLIGKRVYLKGFMWQTQKMDGLTEFVFLKDNGECCFGGSPKPYDMMVVRLADGNTTRAYTGMVAVAGVLNADVSAGEGDPVYTVDATIVKDAPTPF